MTNMSETIRRRVAAIALLGVFAGVAFLSVAMYQKAFTKTETITVEADRAGLQMRAGTIVKYDGTDVGRVESAVPIEGGRARITLAMFPDMLDVIPADAVVSLEQLTAFGNKGVVFRALDDGGVGDGESLKAGTTLRTDLVTVEANQIFENLESLLTTLEPAKVNSVLTGLSTALDGKGERLGESLETAAAYLTKLNQDMPALQRDFDRGADFLDIYSDASGDLLSALEAVTTTADTVTEKRTEIAAVADSITSMSKEGTLFTRMNKDGIDSLVAAALPTTALLRDYAPQTTCVVTMGAESYRKIGDAFGGRGAWADAYISVLGQGTERYENPQDLPISSMALGPKCWEFPTYQGQYLPTGYDDKLDPALSDESFTWYDNELSLNDQPFALYFAGSLASYVPGLAGGAQ